MDEILSYRWSPFAASHTLSRPKSPSILFIPTSPSQLHLWILDCDCSAWIIEARILPFVNCKDTSNCLQNLLPNFPFWNHVVYFVLFSSLFGDNCWCVCEYQVISVWRREKETSPFLLSPSNQFRSLFCRALRRTHQEETQSKEFRRGLEKIKTWLLLWIFRVVFKA